MPSNGACCNTHQQLPFIGADSQQNIITLLLTEEYCYLKSYFSNSQPPPPHITKNTHSKSTHVTVGSEGSVGEGEGVVGLVTPADGGVSCQHLQGHLGAKVKDQIIPHLEWYGCLWCMCVL